MTQNPVLTSPIVPTVTERVIAFVDLPNFHRGICSKLSLAETFQFLSDYYAAMQAALAESEGRIVKFIGDAVLILFPGDKPAAALAALLGLKSAIDIRLARGGHGARVRVKAHVGMVATGPMGTGGLARFDVCGVAVNEAALLPDGDWVLSGALQKRQSE